MNNLIQQNQNRTWITGIPEVRMSPEKKAPSGFDWSAQIRGLTAMLQHRGESVTLQDVMASSGDAFHLCHAAKWELRTAHAMPIDPLINAGRAFGYNARWTNPDWTPRLNKLPKEQRQELTAEYLKNLWTEINSGRPLLIGGVFGECSSWRILAGFDLPNELICLMGGESPYEWTPLWDEKAHAWGFWDMQVRGTIRQDAFLGGWQANASFLLGDKEGVIPARDWMLNTLTLAQSLSLAPAQATDWYGGVTYYFGQNAFKQWAEDLLKLDFPDDLNAPRPESPDIYNLDLMVYQVDQIAQGRAAAAEFCAKAAHQLNLPGLQTATAAYNRQQSIARNALAVFMQDDPEARLAWLSDSRQRKSGAQAVLAMLEEERQAIRSIEQALADLKDQEEQK